MSKKGKTSDVLIALLGDKRKERESGIGLLLQECVGERGELCVIVREIHICENVFVCFCSCIFSLFCFLLFSESSCGGIVFHWYILSQCLIMHLGHMRAANSTLHLLCLITDPFHWSWRSVLYCLVFEGGTFVALNVLADIGAV